MQASGAVSWTAAMRAPRPQAHVADIFAKRGNAIGLLRFALASLVIVHHTRVLGGFGADPIARWTRGQVDLGIVAVAGFFALSGLLITRSAQHASLPRYLWHRCLRILPGYWACLAATALILGPILWLSDHGTLGGYIGTHPSPAGYLARNVALLVNQTTIDALLMHNPYPRALNGSLWTLAYEFSWYLVVALLAWAGLLRRWWAPIIVLALAVLAAVGWRPLGPVPVVGYALASRFGITFAFGILAYVYRDRLPLDDRIAALAVVIFVGTARYGAFGTVGMLALAYLLLWAAWRLPLRGFGTKHDLSYGVYIYGFPVQQSIAHFAGGLPYLGFMAASFAIVVALARLSYSLVESPALRLKHQRPPARIERGLERIGSRLRLPGAARPSDAVATPEVLAPLDVPATPEPARAVAAEADVIAAP